MNINDLPQGSYTEDTPQSGGNVVGNINDLPVDSYSVEPVKDVNTHATSLGIGTRISDTILNAGKQAQEQIAGEGQYAGQNPVTRGVGAAATAAGAIGGVAGDLTPQPVQSLFSKIGSGMNWLVDKISNNKSLQNYAQDLPANNAGEQMLSTLSGAGTIAGTIVGAEGGARGLQKGADLATSAYSKANPSEFSNFVDSKNAAANLEGAKKVVSPKLTTKETAAALAEGRGTGGGLLSKTEITPDARTLQTAEAVKGLVKNGATGAENISNVRTALSNEAETLKAKIQANDHPYSFKELNSALSKVEEPISLKGTPFEKQIGPIKQAAMDIAKKNGGTVSSLLDARKEFDALVEKTYPNLYEKENAPMRNAITGIRNGMNDFIEKNLPKGAGFKDSLKKQSLYYNAIENIAEKAVGETKTTGVERVLDQAKKHPIITGAGTGLGGAAAYEALRK